MPWKTIAPVILPKANVSFLLLIQRMLFTFSGSSVAIGTTIIDKTKTEIPIKEATISIWVTNPLAPNMSRARPKNNCKKILKKLR